MPITKQKKKQNEAMQQQCQHGFGVLDRHKKSPAPWPGNLTAYASGDAVLIIFHTPVSF
jgi:hypothetical protein